MDWQRLESLALMAGPSATDPDESLEEIPLDFDGSAVARSGRSARTERASGSAQVLARSSTVSRAAPPWSWRLTEGSGKGSETQLA
jgi:hypothetical protein